MFRHVDAGRFVRSAAQVVLFVASAASARATDWYVDQAYPNCSASNGSQSMPYCKIVNAVVAAKNGDTIWIAPGVYKEQIATSKDLTLIGTLGAAVTAIDGGGNRRIMTLSPGADVHLHELTLQNGNEASATSCGGCYVDHATLTITDCVLAANEGAIVLAQGASMGALTMERCLVTSNIAGSMTDGGGIRAYSTTATLVISDSRFESNVASGGGAIMAAFGTNTTLERCTFVTNRATGHQFAPGLGGALEGDSFTVVDCLFSDNVALSSSVGAGGNGGAAFLWGSSRFERCRFSGNDSDSTFGQSIGGAVVVGSAGSSTGAATFVDCEIVENVCGAGAASGKGGFGGGVYVATVSTALFERCTVAGNRADGTGTVTSGGTGGGVYCASAGNSLTLAHTIVAGNSAADPAGAPDLLGAAILTLDWNVVGNTTGATFSGSGPNDLLDVDPLFADPAQGDWSLQPISPAVDSGDPAFPLGGKDVAQTSRVLDGDLDRVLRIDRGAHEFSHVRLAVAGAFTPGGTITVDVAGSAGLPVLLVSGVGEAEFPLKPLGSLFVDLSLGVTVLPWGVVPSSTPITIDPALAVPLDVYVQALATSGRAGNLSNLVAFTIE
jgi:hypothetical protein